MTTWQQAIHAARAPYQTALCSGIKDAFRVAEQAFWYVVLSLGIFGLGIVVVEAIKGHR